MAKNILKYHNIYLFIITLSLIGFISGFVFYKVQSIETKNSIKEAINLEEELSSGNNNIIKSIKNSSCILINSIFIITIIINISNIFIKPFEIGFIFSFLNTYNLKFSIIYSFFYLIIPLIFSFILIRIGLTISTNIINLLITKEKRKFTHLKLLFIKYFIVSFFIVLYELIIAIFSSNINSYLMTFLQL